jgi:hypothetical protein
MEFSNSAFMFHPTTGFSNADCTDSVLLGFLSDEAAVAFTATFLAAFTIPQNVRTLRFE